MKKIVSVVAISVLLVLAVVLEQVFVHKTLDSLIAKIEMFDSKISATENINLQEIVDFGAKIDDFWTKKEKILCLSINHNDLNKIGEQIKKINVCVKKNKKNECFYELDILKFYVESYKHVMEISLQNLL